MKTPPALSALITFGAMVSCAACSAQPRPPATGSAPHPLAFVCQAFARQNVSEDLKPLGDIRMSTPGERSVSGGGFRFDVSYENERYETPSLNITVSWEPTGKVIERSLFYFHNLTNPANQFGSQGFTGLQYVYAPGTPAELQYFCSSA